jgi:hypothetical protein
VIHRRSFTRADRERLPLFAYPQDGLREYKFRDRHGDDHELVAGRVAGLRLAVLLHLAAQQSFQVGRFR